MPFIAISNTWMETAIVTRRQTNAPRLFAKNPSDFAPSTGRKSKADIETMAMVRAAAIHCNLGSAIGWVAMKQAMHGKTRYVNDVSTSRAVNLSVLMRINESMEYS